jgi:predicted AlkP superfamily phosphohydrolase/phosphomutase
MGPTPPERRRLLVIGLDGVPPELLFDRFRSQLPRLSKLLAESVRAPLRTTDPPISVPAWPVMFSGVDPGTLGFYGFRHRQGSSYTTTYVPTSAQVPVPTFFDLASSAGRRVAVIGIPMGFPPPAVNGVYISDFLTPPGARDFTSPPELAREIEGRFGPYPFDVVFRAGARAELFDQIVAMTNTRFDIAEWLYDREPWDVFAVHEIGTDRLHHAFWRHFDPGHPQFVPNSPLAHVALDYYKLLDTRIGRLLDRTDERTSVLVASDHGSMPMHGCFCINQWLASKGYLAFRSPPSAGQPIEQADVDWDRTMAWGSGGYYARIFFNERGREAEGVIDASQIPSIRRRLEKDLRTLKGPEGTPLAVRILDPRTIYASVRGDAPDLMLYFDDLRWRSAGTLGHPTMYLKENDIGPDDAVHSWHGVYVLRDPDHLAERVLGPQVIRDVTPSLLEHLGIPIPAHVQGRPIRSDGSGAGPVSA